MNWRGRSAGAPNAQSSPHRSPATPAKRRIGTDRRVHVPRMAKAGLQPQVKSLEVWGLGPAASEPRMSPTPHSTSTNALENRAEAWGAYLAQSAIAKNLPSAVTDRSSARVTAAPNDAARDVCRQVSRAEPSRRTPVSGTNRPRAARRSSSATTPTDALTTTRLNQWSASPSASPWSCEGPVSRC